MCPTPSQPGMTVKRNRPRDTPRVSFDSGKRRISYGEMFWKLPPKERQKINDTIISAVERLNDAEGRAPPGTKTFLEGRARQLITDTKREGFTKAAQRLRVAVKGWQRERAYFYRPSDGPVAEPSAKTTSGRRWAPLSSALKTPPAPAEPYVPNDGEVDLLLIPPSLDRKAEIPLDHRLRRRRKARAKAA